MLEEKNSSLEPCSLITKALINLQQELDITNECLANVLGIEPEQLIGELDSDSNLINDEQREAALILIRIYRSLHGILGENPTARKHWLNTHNSHLNGMPIRLIQAPANLYKIVKYLEATQDLSMDNHYVDFVRCPNCGTKIEFDYGLSVECGKCGLEIMVDEGDVHQGNHVHILSDEF